MKKFFFCFKNLPFKPEFLKVDCVLTKNWKNNNFYSYHSIKIIILLLLLLILLLIILLLILLLLFPILTQKINL